MADAFFFENPRSSQGKGFNHSVRQRKKWKKQPYFHHTVEMEQPHPTIGPNFINCVVESG